MNYFSDNTKNCKDYYAFGSLMPGRSFNPSDYRFGFNGMEKDDEWNGNTGTILDFGFRIYDDRVARFLSVDPLKKDFPWNSPYNFSENRVIDGVELEGLEVASYLKTQMFGGVGTTELTVEGDVGGAALTGVRYKYGIMGIGYDEHNNIALYTERGGFANIFSGLFSYDGGIGKESEFNLGLGIGLELEESYDWALNNVMDLSNEASSLNAQFTIYGVIGADIGFNYDDKDNVIGFNLGSSFGPGLPFSIDKTKTKNSAFVAMRPDEFKDFSMAAMKIISMKSKGYATEMNFIKEDNGYFNWSINFIKGDKKETYNTNLKFKAIGKNKLVTPGYANNPANKSAF